MNIPTAEEMVNKWPLDDSNWSLVDRELFHVTAIIALKEYAKLHVKAQTYAILKRLELRGGHNTIDKNIIINTYPLDNIK